MDWSNGNSLHSPVWPQGRCLSLQARFKYKRAKTYGRVPMFHTFPASRSFFLYGRDMKLEDKHAPTAHLLLATIREKEPWTQRIAFGIAGCTLTKQGEQGANIGDHKHLQNGRQKIWSVFYRSQTGHWRVGGLLWAASAEPGA